MATTAQVKTFIATLSKLAVKEYAKRKSSGNKWVLPSVCIAQAALETGWGTSPIMIKAHAYFGIKAGTNWSGKVYSSKAQECYDGVNTTITDLFRAYDSVEESVADYFDLITSLGRYAFACNQTNAKTCIQAILDGGYATDPDYVTQVMAIINQYDLTQYDQIVSEGGENVSKIEKAVTQMEEWANDSSHGYDQIYRWGEKGDYDCSSATIQACENAGIPLKSNGATYTGDMKPVALACGFKDVTGSVNLSTGAGLKRGDILLNEDHHVAMYCGNGKEVEASINEKGTATGGQPGDQTGKEFLIRSYRNYPWDCVLRYQEDGSTSSGNSGSSKGEATKIAVSYPARMSKDIKAYVDAGVTQSKLFPEIKKDTLVDVMKHTEKDAAGKNWYLVRLPHPDEGFVYEFVPAGSFRHLK